MFLLLVFSASHLVKPLWDHEAYFGVAVIEASFLFYLPLIDIVVTPVNSEKRTAPSLYWARLFCGVVSGWLVER